MRSARISILCLAPIVLGLAMGEGCSTFDADNVAGRPWNRPPKWVVESDWLCYPSTFDSGREPGDLRPGNFYP
ncbi:MAG TPA: hypothetical protein VJT54_04015 [Verrucomicrobiae bacterium]|nr:hypothetical protein [Verrucomicrobiae bacterium]